MKVLKNGFSTILIALFLVLTPFNANFFAQAEEGASSLKLIDASVLGQFEVRVEPGELTANISSIKLNNVLQQEKESKYQAFYGGFYLDKDNHKIIMQEPSDGATITVIMKDGKVFNYLYNKTGNKAGQRFVLQTSEGTGSNNGNTEPEKPNPGNNGGADVSNLKVTDYSSFGEFKLNLDPKEAIDQISEISLNRAKQEAKTSKWLTFNGGYYLDKATGSIIMNEPRDEALITIKLQDGKSYNYKYVRGNKVGQRMVLQSDDEVNSKKVLKVRLVGYFEGAVQGQKKYDAISGASISATANKNSNVQVQAAEVESEDVVVDEKSWKPLNELNNLYLDRKQFKISLSADSGMTANYNVYDSSITLSGTPTKIGKYPVTVTVMDAAGHKATSNALYFEVFGTNEKLEDHLKVENARKMYDGKYIWDMSPWIINEFTHDSSQTVTVPKDIKAWYGSNTTGVYGKLGQPVLQGEPTKHTLIIPSGANLTMVNMISNSSVRIVIKDGAKLNLKDTSIYGEVVVEKGGTFSMNHETDHLGNSKFTNGAMINGQLILEDGATLDNAKIYSNANFLTDGNKAKKIDTPVVVMKGNININGNVFIRGDESATGEYNGRKVGGQPALKIENGKVNITKGSVLGVYGGGRMATTSIGGNALELANGEVTGEGKLIAVGGSSTWGTAGHGVTGNGKITVKNALLNGGNSYGSGSIAGKAFTDGVKVYDTTIGKATDGRVLKGSSENDQPLYWNDITKVAPFGDELFGSDKISNEKQEDHQNTTPGGNSNHATNNEASDYYIESGANSDWDGSDKDLLIVVKARNNDEKTFDQFRGVEVDGKIVAPSNYEAVRGSVRIKLRASFLKTLSEGRHTALVRFNNGSVSTSFTVTKASSASVSTPASNAQGKVAKTVKTPVVGKRIVRSGDNTSLWFLFIFTTASIILASALVFRKKYR